MLCGKKFSLYFASTKSIDTVPETCAPWVERESDATALQLLQILSIVAAFLHLARGRISNPYLDLYRYLAKEHTAEISYRPQLSRGCNMASHVFASGNTH